MCALRHPIQLGNMWSVRDRFYEVAEPVWILKEDNKKDESKGAGDSQASRGGNKKQAERAEEYPNLSAVPYYPYRDPYYFYPEYIPPPSQPKREEPSKGGATQQQQQKKEMRVELKVPICCGECVELIEGALYRLKGVKSVVCDTYKEKVTITATTATPADIFIECRKVFKKSRMWTDDD